jgi:hypothetical protein
MLCSSENNCAPGCRSEIDDDGKSIIVGHVQHMMGHRVDRRLFGIDAMSDRVSHVALDDYVNALVECGREQKMLCVVGSAIEQTLHTWKKSEIGHVIGLIENTNFNSIEFAEVLADQIFESTGTSDNDIDSLSKRVDLRVLTNATEDCRGTQSEATSKRRNGCVDLQRKFTSGRKDQRTRAERLTIELQHREPSQHSKTECEGLTGTGATTAENITALQ